MIAIVPDPVHSHLSVIFDRSLEALQSAGAATQYVMDRYWLPWQLETSEDSAKNEEEPGLLLFRRDTPPDLLQDGSPDPDTPSALYVFLVSDTSTAGINGTQFRNAVHYLLQVCGTPANPAGRTGHDNRIWIMGPTSSAPLRPLRAPPDSPRHPVSDT